MLGIHRYINTLSISSGVCVCVQTGRGHLFYDATHYLLHTLIGCSINQSHFISLSREIDDCVCEWERRRERVEANKNKVAKKGRDSISQLTLNIADASFPFVLRVFFSFRSFIHLDNGFLLPFLFFPFLSFCFFFFFFILPSVLVLTFPYHRHRSIIFSSVYP